MCGLASVVVGLVALSGWAWGGPREAVGAVVGGIVTVVNFRWLGWTTAVVLGRPAGAAGGGWRSALWVGGSVARMGAVALALGVALAQGWVGIGGLLAAAAVVPVAVVTEGLRAARLD